jgi:ABC-type sugar transport system ATPase subunit
MENSMRFESNEMNHPALASPQTGEVVFHVDSVSKRYFGTTVLDRINFDLREGEVHGVIGKNGAGKSTLVNIMHGSESPSSGMLEISGRKFDRLTPAKAHEAGVVLVPQKVNYALDLTIAETLFLGSTPTVRFGIVSSRRLFEDARAILSRLQLNIDPRTTLSSVPFEQRRLIEVARALWVNNAKVLILDETTAALSVGPRERLFDIMLKTKETEKRCFVFISHRLEEMIDVCDRITVLRNGKLVATTPTSELTEESLAELITGGTVQREARQEARGRRTHRVGGLELQAVGRSLHFSDVSLKVPIGKIVGITGMVGSGYSDVLRYVAGLNPDGGSGCVLVDGREQVPSSPHEMMKASLGYLTSKREEEAIFHDLSITHNAVGGNFARFLSRLGIIDRKKVHRSIESLKASLDIKMGQQAEAIDTLSGGNKQKVVVGRLLAHRLSVYLFDEIAEGVDIASRKTLFRFVRDEVSRDSAVLMASNVVSDLMEVCDRILVMFNGRITLEIPRENFDEHEIYRAIQGLNTRPSSVEISKEEIK